MVISFQNGRTKCFNLFANDVSQKSREISVPATSQRIQLSEISPSVGDKLLGVSGLRRFLGGCAHPRHEKSQIAMPAPFEILPILAEEKARAREPFDLGPGFGASEVHARRGGEADERHRHPARDLWPAGGRLRAALRLGPAEVRG